MSIKQWDGVGLLIVSGAIILKIRVLLGGIEYKVCSLSSGARELAQWSRTLTALPGEPSLVSSL